MVLVGLALGILTARCFYARLPNMIRTTVRFEDNLFKDARKKAIDDGLAFATIVNQALKIYLKKGTNKTKKQKFELKVYNLGAIKGSLSRTELYEDI